MPSRIVSFFLIFFLLPVAGSPGSEPPESTPLTFAGFDWEPGLHREEAHLHTSEYVPFGETSGNWTRFLSTQHHLGKSVEEAVRAWLDYMDTRRNLGIGKLRVTPLAGNLPEDQSFDVLVISGIRNLIENRRVRFVSHPDLATGGTIQMEVATRTYDQSDYSYIADLVALRKELARHVVLP